MDFGSYRDSVDLLEKKKSVSWLTWFCLSPFTKYVLPSFLLALLLVVSVYLGVLAYLPRRDHSASQSTCHLQASYHVPCLPGELVSSNECSDVGCCWREDLSVCYHPFPSPYGYRVDGRETANDKTITPLRKSSPTGKPLRKQLGFHVDQVNDYHVRIALKTNTKTASKRDSSPSNKVAPTNRKLNKLSDFGQLFNFLPPDDQAQISKLSLGRSSGIEVLLHEPQFSVTLRRSSSGTVLLSTARGPLIVTDNYWEWTLYLTSATLYGLNSLELNGTSNWIYNNENATMRPAFLAIDRLGNAVSCLVDYTGPLEVQVLNESNLVILRGLSVPDELAIDVFDGPEGLQAVQRLAGANLDLSRPITTALKTSLYGLHLCPEEPRKKSASPTITTEETALESLKCSIESMKSLGVPWDSHCLYRQLGGLGLQRKLSADEEKLVAEARQLLLKNGKSLAMHLTPQLSNKADGQLQASLGQESCLLRNASAPAYAGVYEGRSVVYPDWTRSKTQELARDSLDKYIAGLSPDFVVLRDSWPKDEADKPPMSEKSFDYLPKGLRQLMQYRTVPYDLYSDPSQHYIRHNSYAEQFVKFVGASSAYLEVRGEECNAASGKASWSSMRRALEAGIASAMLGRMPSAMYVCGAEDPYNRIDEELCVRWYGAAVAWPHIVSLPEKSPGCSRLSKTSARRAANLLRLRASLATYQHTALAGYHETGFPLLSATLLHYTRESQPRNTTLGQFFWGDGILVGLVTSPKRKQVHMWLPGRSPWRHLHECYGGSALNSTGNGSVSITAAVGQIVTLLRPGRIVPVHEIGSEEVLTSTAETMLKNLKLLANPVCTDNEATCSAEGRVYYTGNNDNAGEFLLVSLLDAKLTLENVSKVQGIACGAAAARKQTTVIERVEVVGIGYAKVELDFCKNIDPSSSKIQLSLTLVRPSTCES